MKPKAVVWFTGVFTKYTVSDFSVLTLKLNNSLIKRLSDKYELILLICVKDAFERKEYDELLATNNLYGSKVVFLPYNFDFDETFISLLDTMPDITTYIDYSKSRLISASAYLRNENLIHISQLLD